MRKRILQGRYLVQSELARGGMGRVLKARDLQLERDVAIKAILPNAGELGRARFVEEAQISGQLSHPNIIPVHEMGTERGIDGDELFLCMKLVEGRDMHALSKELRDDPAVREDYPVRRLLRLFLKVCEAMSFAHDQGVIHRDLKPANVMLGRNDEVLVMDWGVAKPIDDQDEVSTLGQEQLARLKQEAGEAAEARAPTGRRLGAVRSTVREAVEGAELTQAGLLVGTPAYMSPEQADGMKLDARADVYSLGAILYQLLAWRPPFTGSSIEALGQLMRHAPPRPSVVAKEADIPPAVEAIVLKAMARERDDRYDDATALAADVEAYLDGRAVSAHDEGPIDVVRRLVRRHKAASMTLAAAIVLVNLMAVVSAVLVSREETRLVAEKAELERARSLLDDAAALEKAVGRAVRLAAEAAREVAELERRAPSALGLENETGGEDGRSLLSIHLRAADRIARLRAQVVEMRDVVASAAAEQGEGEGGEIADASPFTAVIAEIDLTRRRLDVVYADALMGRSPTRVLGVLDELEVGEAAPLLRARALLRLGRRREALTALQAGGGPPEDPRLAAASEALRLRLSEARLGDQLAAFDEAIERSGGEAWLYLRRAEARASAGDMEGAVADYDEATQLGRVDAWNHSSRLLHTYPLFTTKMAGHMRSFVQLISEENFEVEVFAARVGMWNHGNVQAMVELVARLETDAPLHANRVGAEAMLIMKSRLDDAEAYAKKALALEPGDRVGLGCLAEVELRRGRLDEAQALADRGLRGHPDDGRLNRVRGAVAMRRGRYREAMPWLERGAAPALESEPWRVLAECCSYLDDPAAWERGIAAGRKALSLDPYAVLNYHGDARPVPGEPGLHRVLGDLRRRQGQLAAAAIHYVRAMSMTGQNGPNRAYGPDLSDGIRAGEVHEEMGLLGEALVLYASVARDERLAKSEDAELIAVREEAQRRMERLMRGR